MMNKRLEWFILIILAAKAQPTGEIRHPGKKQSDNERPENTEDSNLRYLTVSSSPELLDRLANYLYGDRAQYCVAIVGRGTGCCLALEYLKRLNVELSIEEAKELASKIVKSSNNDR